MAGSSGRGKEISLGDGFGDAAVTVNRVRVKVRTGLASLRGVR